MRLCETCRRESRGFGKTTWDDIKRIDTYYCSTKCRDFKSMVDWTIREATAIQRGGKLGGEYLDSIGVYSLDKLNKEQWDTFLDCIFKEYFLAITDHDAIHSHELY